MTVISKPRRSRGLKSMRAAVVASAAIAGLVVSNGTANAAVDSSNSIVDGAGNTITVTLSDTFVNSVSPLDGNPLTREWFGNGRASWEVTGPSADDFEGTVKIGYQVGYPASLGGEVSIDWATPSVTAGLSTSALISSANGGAAETEQSQTNGIDASVELLPVASANVTFGPGPGIQTAEGAVAVINESADVQGGEGDAAGSSGSVQIANSHGTVTGVLGNVRVRPFVSVVSSTGDVAITYGAPWVFN